MKVIFTSSRISSPSYQFYRQNLEKLSQADSETYIELSDDPKSVDYSTFDVALFMGFDPQALLAKQTNPNILIGVVEPRATQENTFEMVDFIVVNCIEAKDYFSRFNHNIMIYYAYPQVPERLDCPQEKKNLVLGYHGNKIHLDEAFPRITDAIDKLSKEITVELWAMYNIKNLGRWQLPDEKGLGFKVNHIQYGEENYAKYIAHVDIGIVPQLIPIRKNRLLMFLLSSFDRKYKENENNYLIRFKDTTNIGRHLVFAQYGIPVVSDMTPSGCDFIDDEFDSFIAYSTAGWYRALRMLAINPILREQMGKRLHDKYQKNAKVETLNKKLLSFIREYFRNRVGS